jgi:FkbM family methyltransferase
MSKTTILDETGGYFSRRVLPVLNAFAMRRLKQSVYLKGLLYRILWLLPESLREQNSVRSGLKLLAQTSQPVFFINIGANDGLAGDPLREFIVTRGWRGILVEPVDYVFQRLKKAYHSYPAPQIILENVAIADITGPKLFWHLEKTAELPAGYDQIGSFIKSHVLKFKETFPGLEEHLVSHEVSCFTLTDLLRKHAVQRVDLVLIDTEGYDYEIIKQIDLVDAPPKIIIFENAHLSLDDRQACNDLLHAHDFVVSEAGINTVAMLSREFPDLS